MNETRLSEIATDSQRVVQKPRFRAVVENDSSRTIHRPPIQQPVWQAVSRSTYGFRDSRGK